MHQVPLVVPLLLLAVLVPAACSLHLSPPSPSSKGRHRQTFHLPRHAIANDDQGREIDSSRLRHALQQLLELNDGELQTLMAGMSPRELASRIEPSTAFLLASSRQYLERLNTILATVEDTSPVKKSTWNPRIAQRHKKERQNRRSDKDNSNLEEHPNSIRDITSGEDDPDSILGALTELSAYLAGTEEDAAAITRQERKRRSHHPVHGRKHQTLQAHGSRQYEAHHYLYYLRTGECPISDDGNPKMYCPSPSDSGHWTCIEDIELCDGIPQCPNQEDEAPTHCLFHNAMKAHLDELTKYIVLSNLS